MSEGLLPAVDTVTDTMSIESMEDTGNYFFKAVLTKCLTFETKYVKKDMSDLLSKLIAAKFEGKCSENGYIRPNSTNLLTFSGGNLKANYIKYDVVFECEICNPVEEMKIRCVVKNVTKAGIRAEVPYDNENSPMVIFIARDHHYNNTDFNELEIGDAINISVIGVRARFNDTYVSVIAQLIGKVDGGIPFNK